jgi:hypothetical protein
MRLALPVAAALTLAACVHEPTYVRHPDGHVVAHDHVRPDWKTLGLLAATGAVIGLAIVLPASATIAVGKLAAGGATLALFVYWVDRPWLPEE